MILDLFTLILKSKHSIDQSNWHLCIYELKLVSLCKFDLFDIAYTCSGFRGNIIKYFLSILCSPLSLLLHLLEEIISVLVIVKAFRLGDSLQDNILLILVHLRVIHTLLPLCFVRIVRRGYVEESIADSLGLNTVLSH